MKKRLFTALLSIIGFLVFSCQQLNMETGSDLSGSESRAASSGSEEWYGTHEEGKILMIIGQDLEATWNYVQSGQFPTPGGISSYMPLPDLMGLWEEVDWGAGPVCTLSAAEGYPQSALAVGVYMVEDEWNPNRLNEIASGSVDDKIGEFGWFIGNKCVAEINGETVPYPVYVRLGFEFDGSWNHYDPAEYIAAFQHVVDVIRPLAPNAVFVWQSSTSPIDDIIEGGLHEDLMQWYPGDDYVDMMGLSWFLSQDPKQYELADELVNLARSHGKPVMISESTPQGYDLTQLTKSNISPVYDGTAGGSTVSKSSQQIWNEWYQPYFDYIYDNSDVIRVVAYINCDWDSQAKWGAPYPEGYWGDTRVQQNSYVADKWNTELSKNIWAHGSLETLTSLNGGEGVITPPDDGSDDNGSGDDSSDDGSSGDDSSDDGSGDDSSSDDDSGSVVLGPLTNGSSFNWNVSLSESGMYRAEITSDSSQNSQLIEVSLNGSSTINAIDGGSTVTAYMHNVSAGAAVLSITAQSDSVSISNVKLYAPGGSEISLAVSDDSSDTGDTGSGDDSGSDDGSSDDSSDNTGSDVVLGALTNGSSFDWSVSLSESGMYRAEITSDSSQNSQLIEVSLNGSSSINAIDGGATITSYMHNVSAGSAVFSITAQSDAVSISAVKLIAPNGSEIALSTGSGNDTGDSDNGSDDSDTGDNSDDDDTTLPPVTGDGPGDPQAGQTLVMIGQTFLDEYQSYISGTGVAPAGSSHYAEIYAGALNQGDDADNLKHLNWIYNNYPGSTALVAISIKDNPGAGGYGSTNPNDPTFNPRAVYDALVDINNGDWDAEIDAIADVFKSHSETTFYVRIGYEVSMGMFANSTTTDWNDVLTYYAEQGLNILEDPSLAPEIDLSQYRGAYNHIADRIRNVNGVSNVEFVYHPVRGFGDCKALYPGDQYVDWVGFSIFNHDVCIDTLEADGSIVSNGDDRLDSNLQQCIEWAQDKGKKLMVAESAFQTPGSGQSDSAFIEYLDRLFDVVETYDFRAVTYINSDWTAHNWSLPWGDSRVESSNAVKNWWLNRISGSRYINY